MATESSVKAMTVPDLGKVAYDAYFFNSKGNSLISGAALPSWEQQADAIKNAWRAAAGAVITALFTMPYDTVDCDNANGIPAFCTVEPDEP